VRERGGLAQVGGGEMTRAARGGGGDRRRLQARAAGWRSSGEREGRVPGGGREERQAGRPGQRSWGWRGSGEVRWPSREGGSGGSRIDRR